MLAHRRARPKSGEGITVEFAPFSGNMNQGLEIALWAKGRLKGGPGNFIIEIDDGLGFTSVTKPGQVMTKNVDGDIVIYDAPRFIELYEEITEDDEEDEL